MARKKKGSGLPSYIRKGGGVVSGGNSLFLPIKDGDSVLFAPLVKMDDVLSVDMHEIWEVRPAIFIPCIGPGCIPCAKGHDNRFRAYLPVLTKDGETRIVTLGVKAFRQLESIAEDVDIQGMVMRYKRTGSGRYNTEYTLVAIGKRQDVSSIEVPDVVSAIGPTDMEGIEQLWIQAGFIDSVDEDDEDDFVGEDDEEETPPFEVSEEDDEEEWDPNL